jgi:hypothetical protein
MRRIAILIVAAGLSAAGTTPAAAQLLEAPLPDVQLPDPEVPEVELPEPLGDDGGSDPASPVEMPSIGDGSASGGSHSGDSGGSLAGSGGGGSGGGGEKSCPCAARATGYPVAGDYDKCPEQDGTPGAASDEAGSVLAASRSASSGGDTGPSGGVLGAGAFGEVASEPPSADAAPFSEDSGAGPFVWAVLALAAVTLLIGIAGGLRAIVRRRG